jgi:hypothetical protein
VTYKIVFQVVLEVFKRLIAKNTPHQAPHTAENTGKPVQNQPKSIKYHQFSSFSMQNTKRNSIKQCRTFINAMMLFTNRSTQQKRCFSVQTHCLKSMIFGFLGVFPLSAFVGF